MRRKIANKAKRTGKVYCEVCAANGREPVQAAAHGKCLTCSRLRREASRKGAK